MSSKQFAIYRQTDGSFIRSVFCEAALAPLQSNASEIAIEDSREFAALENTYLDVVGNQIIDMPSKPGQWYRFDHQEKQWVADNEGAEFEVRMNRQILLSKSDWTDTASAPARLGQALYEQWQTYRQALRDIPSQRGFPTDINWPQPPAN